MRGLPGGTGDALRGHLLAASTLNGIIKTKEADT
jgi:hypothetical protein